MFTLNFHEFLHTVYKYVLNSVVKIPLMFAHYFEYYDIILRGSVFLVDTLYICCCTSLICFRMLSSENVVGMN